MNFDPRFQPPFGPQRPPWLPPAGGSQPTPAQEPNEEDEEPMPSFEVVKHPSAPPQLPYAIRDNHTGGYVTGSSPLFPKVFATPAEAHQALQEHVQSSGVNPSISTGKVPPQMQNAVNISQPGGFTGYSQLAAKKGPAGAPVISDKGSSKSSSTKPPASSKDTAIKIYNPGHYTPPYVDSRGGHGPVRKMPGYDNRGYTIDIPAGQNVDANIAAAQSYNQIVAAQSGRNAVKGFFMKKRYLEQHVANGTVGDYGKNFKLYPSKDPKVIWQRRLAGNFNLGAVGAAMGFKLNTLLDAGQWKSIENTGGRLHPQQEQDAIEDGYWYFYSTHPAAVKADGVTIPKGFNFKR